MSKKLKSIDGLVVNTKVLANIFGLTERRVRQLVEEGVIDRIGHGRYDLQDSLKKYIAFLRAAASAEVDSSKVKENLDYEKFLHERAKREKAELELAHLKGELHHSADVEKVMNDMLGAFRSKLLALPAKLAPMLIAQNTVATIQDMLQNEIYEALKELSNYDPELFYGPKYLQDIESDDDDDE
ncbi:hypothetical protein [Tepidanaerobacter syntrophicus]|uniref:Phage DNA packaging protein, Nu1 subunit of terminase n=1 Tax=Tepidanaerobacter syntrophicus TaxID=224999 RepID=A0A0U9HMP1_9FIRM|nr:hypothetical protein [Tepidanaerobacter syntrophicus]GAQ24231.1 phage DNA packaging protein, Nu1 subunit of terminase [Tepidanaerobacter syntrophicus]